MKKNKWGWISLVLVLLLSVGVFAQDSEGDGNGGNEMAASGSTSSSDDEGVRLDEAVFALIAVAIVMAGLIGFEFIQRSKRTD